MNNMIESWLHPERGYQKAADQINQGYNQSQQYYRDAQGNLQPFVQQGMDQYGRLNQQANALGDPAALEAQWANSYKTSPEAMQALSESKNTGENEASSMGLMGSSAAVNNIQKNAGNIQEQDRSNYMNNLMQKYLASVGIGQNLYGIGANAAGQQSQNSMGQGQNAINSYNNLASAAYGQQNAPGQLFGGLLGAGGNALINYFTGGLNNKSPR